jgi:mRNA interferase HigB
MVIIAKRTLNQWALDYPVAEEALIRWHTLFRQNSFDGLQSMRGVFSSASHLGNHRYAFNIKGNAFRLIVMIHFPSRTAYLRWFGTHTEYDELNKNGQQSNV